MWHLKGWASLQDIVSFERCQYPHQGVRYICQPKKKCGSKTLCLIYLPRSPLWMDFHQIWYRGHLLDVISCFDYSWKLFQSSPLTQYCISMLPVLSVSANVVCRLVLWMHYHCQWPALWHSFGQAVSTTSPSVRLTSTADVVLLVSREVSTLTPDTSQDDFLLCLLHSRWLLIKSSNYLADYYEFVLCGFKLHITLVIWQPVPLLFAGHKKLNSEKLQLWTSAPAFYCFRSCHCCHGVIIRHSWSSHWLHRSNYIVFNHHSMQIFKYSQV